VIKLVITISSEVKVDSVRRIITEERSEQCHGYGRDVL
jgi:hypothetical protein